MNSIKNIRTQFVAQSWPITKEVKLEKSWKSNKSCAWNLFYSFSIKFGERLCIYVIIWCDARVSKTQKKDFQHCKLACFQVCAFMNYSFIWQFICPRIRHSMIKSNPIKQFFAGKVAEVHIWNKVIKTIIIEYTYICIKSKWKWKLYYGQY